MRRYILSSFFLVIAMVFLMNGCSAKLESISIVGNSEIPIDGSAVLSIVKHPAKAKINNIEWKSSNETIVKVDDGIIIGVSRGKATITAKVGNNAKATKDIIVYAPTESIVADKTELNLSLNEEHTLHITINPTDAIYTWLSDNPSVATVSSDGKVIAKNYGKAKIIAKSKDNKEAICAVSVSVTVPNFASMSSAEAKKWGEYNRIIISTNSDYSNSVTKGKVISQSVDAGTNIIEQGKRIEIVYSIGHKPTIGEANALKRAKEYLRSGGFSAKSLKEQLKYEGYSNIEAQYGIDNCGANWKEQAAGRAKDYLRSSAFSRNGLLEQLLYEGFTQSQAEYGVKAAGY